MLDQLKKFSVGGAVSWTGIFLAIYIFAGAAYFGVDDFLTLYRGVLTIDSVDQ